MTDEQRLKELPLEVEARLKVWIQTQHGSAGWQQKLANLMLKELSSAITEAEERGIAKGREELLKVLDWATGDDVGASSKFLCRFMLGLPTPDVSVPFDSADRGRCIRLLNSIPGWWNRIDELVNLPSRQVNFFSNGALSTREEGWKQQTEIIKKEKNEK